MADLNIHASPEFLKELNWQLSRLSIFIEMVEGLAVSLRDMHGTLSVLAREEQMRR